MSNNTKHALVVGGTSGTGYAVARLLADRGGRVTVTGRDAGRAAAAAGALGPLHAGLALDLTDPGTIADCLSPIGAVDQLVLIAAERDANSIAELDVPAAQRALSVKVLGYTAVISAVLPSLTAAAAIVLVGGTARKFQYPGSTNVGVANGAVTAMARTFALELAPIRVNAVHPGAIADSPALADAAPAFLEGIRRQTPSARLPTMRDVAEAIAFLLDNAGVNGVNLEVDAGFPAPPR